MFFFKFFYYIKSKSQNPGNGLHGPTDMDSKCLLTQYPVLPPYSLCSSYTDFLQFFQTNALRSPQDIPICSFLILEFPSSSHKYNIFSLNVMVRFLKL